MRGSVSNLNILGTVMMMIEPQQAAAPVVQPEPNRNPQRNHRTSVSVDVNASRICQGYARASAETSEWLLEAVR